MAAQGVSAGAALRRPGLAGVENGHIFVVWRTWRAGQRRNSLAAPA